eukprot:TRINITY_DN8893_c0_g4_i1.p1 TRINITY_DN8893_c0_g4~~TRINITY_DN8893_c0_g4_i1.p1  ORF type:complete len:341 (-),score=21.08 TRINITY_DN8893_c0_g4_i1:99-1121(-)
MPLFGGRKKKRNSQSVPDLPKLDLFLTSSTLALFVADVWLLRQSSQEGEANAVLELIVAIAATCAGIACCKAIFRPIGAALQTEEAAKKPRNIRKFADQSWQLVIHAGMTVWELHLMNENGWELWTNTASLWYREGQPCRPSLRSIYIAQMAIWFVTSFFHKFIEARHNDYFLMYSHHVVTLLLVTISLACGWTDIGLVVLLIHDSSDIVIDLLKMVNYMGLDGNSGTFLAEILFVINLVTWPTARMWYLPRKVIQPTLPLRWGWGDYPREVPYLSISMATRFLLASLVVMHVWWYYLFIRILVRLLRGNSGHDAGRDYEGSSEDSEIASDDDGKTIKKG